MARVQPWEQQDDEPNEQYEKFLKYVQMPRAERSVMASYYAWSGKTREEQPRPGGQWFTDANTYKWRERALAWDREQDRLLFAKLSEKRIKSLLPIAELGASMREKAALAVRALAPIETMTTVVNGQTVMVLKTPLTPEQIVKLADTGVKLEQLAVGNPTERTHVGGDPEAPIGVALDDARGVLKKKLDEIRKRRAESQRTADENDEGGEADDTE